MAKKFSELRSKMSASAREEALQHTQLMLTESAALQATEFLPQQAAAAKQGDLAQLLLQVKAREPLAGDELPE